ncbi:LamG-like jellyroll fold domain-containing protein [Alienimonas californiensis]|uniref:FecR protein n=1 Tax=Alienimonas californiensis TaxID=2527989 RepID=A0A517PA09_9PLAN|nr:LamG-like jellyroll fold domain-containing protein [Alienimonas californiensis]QDT16204.1 FecR protein [Alienimonas californiensis]
MNDPAQQTPNAGPDRALLLEGFVDGTLNEADLLALEAELSVDPAFRQRLYRRLTLESLLEETVGPTGGTPPPTPVSPAAAPRAGIRSRRWVAAALLATAAGLLAAALFLPDWDGAAAPPAGGALAETGAEPDEETASGFGVVSGQEDTEWGGVGLRTGELVPGGPLRLEAGSAHLELFSGVRLLVRGPAAFTVDSAMRVTVASGRVQARVPEPAVGFRLRTAAGELVDLGTEFAVDAGTGNAQDEVRVRVLDGAVTLSPSRQDASGGAKRIEPGGVWRWSADAVRPGDAASLSAAPLDDARRRLEEARRDRLAAWQSARADWLADPRLIAWYAPAAAEDGVVPNLAANQTDRTVTASAGTVVAAEPAPDRWERAGGALDVSRPGSRVRIAVEGESAGLTLLCWVRIGSLDRDYNSLLLSDGHRARSPHWQLLRDGRLFFSLKLPEDAAKAQKRAQTKFLSPPVWTPARSGRWVMLAVALDPVAGEVRHYVDGEPVSRHALAPAVRDAATRVQIGRATIGNWTEPVYSTDPEFTVRNFNGRIGETAAFAAPLSAAEIRTLFSQGTPDAN